MSKYCFEPAYSMMFSQLINFSPCQAKMRVSKREFALELMRTVWVDWIDYRARSENSQLSSTEIWSKVGRDMRVQQTFMQTLPCRGLYINRLFVGTTHAHLSEQQAVCYVDSCHLVWTDIDDSSICLLRFYIYWHADELSDERFFA
jgi:hypothetical protein